MKPATKRKDLSRNFSKEARETANRNIKRYSTLSITGEFKLKAKCSITKDP